MKELYEVLEMLGLDVYRQGSMTEDQEYPEAFLTFWEHDCETIHYDNRSIKALHYVWIYVYASPKEMQKWQKKVKNVLEKTKNIVIQKEFIDVGSDVQTHIGKMLSICVAERKEEECNIKSGEVSVV